MLLLVLILFGFLASVSFSVVVSRQRQRQRQQIERLIEDAALLEAEVRDQRSPRREAQRSSPTEHSDATDCDPAN